MVYRLGCHLTMGVFISPPVCALVFFVCVKEVHNNGSVLSSHSALGIAFSLPFYTVHSKRLISLYCSLSGCVGEAIF